MNFQTIHVTKITLHTQWWGTHTQWQPFSDSPASMLMQTAVSNARKRKSTKLIPNILFTLHRWASLSSLKETYCLSTRAFQSLCNISLAATWWAMGHKNVFNFYCHAFNHSAHNSIIAWEMAKEWAKPRRQFSQGWRASKWSGKSQPGDLRLLTQEQFTTLCIFF